ncbi:hypothetical protein BDK51DRAFT_52612 [Blyttiomyces helicus]|uniref:Uncharacterized protein n=1 Tax=Blyttiomyces helicus TaxID=388810 RepID=A0A4P9WIW8_9FUNG|nr:hypothetical protein BDK51DRAFT_52612 [Blyttiomyces helicus]|eukprot:RKO90526.1 hypothetical protein BDK51DRAFT_52612 [Blyttiomyces helicus]
MPVHAWVRQELIGKANPETEASERGTPLAPTWRHVDLLDTTLMHLQRCAARSCSSSSRLWFLHIPTAQVSVNCLQPCCLPISLDFVATDLLGSTVPRFPPHRLPDLTSSDPSPPDDPAAAFCKVGCFGARRIGLGLVRFKCRYFNAPACEGMEGRHSSQAHAGRAAGSAYLVVGPPQSTSLFPASLRLIALGAASFWSNPAAVDVGKMIERLIKAFRLQNSQKGSLLHVKTSKQRGV